MGRGVGCAAAVAFSLILVAAGLPAATGARPGPWAPTDDDDGSDQIDVGCTARIHFGATEGSCESTITADDAPSFTPVIFVHALAAAEATVDVSWYSDGDLYYRLHCTHVAGTGTPLIHQHVALRMPAPDEHGSGSPLQDAPSTCTVTSSEGFSTGTQRITVEVELEDRQVCVHPFRACGFHGGFDLSG